RTIKEIGRPSVHRVRVVTRLTDEDIAPHGRDREAEKVATRGSGAREDLEKRPCRAVEKVGRPRVLWVGRADKDIAAHGRDREAELVAGGHVRLAEGHQKHPGRAIEEVGHPRIASDRAVTGNSYEDIGPHGRNRDLAERGSSGGGGLKGAEQRSP